MVQLEKVNELLAQEVTRKEFLRYIGVAVLGVIGITSMMNNIQKTIAPTQLVKQDRAAGYGLSAYGR